MVVRFGTKSAFRGPDLRTVLFANVVRCDTGATVTDHIWFTVGITLDRLALNPGDYVEFDARVTVYRKGLYHDEFDFRLSRPTAFAVTRAPVREMAA